MESQGSRYAKPSQDVGGRCTRKVDRSVKSSLFIEPSPFVSIDIEILQEENWKEGDSRWSPRKVDTPSRHKMWCDGKALIRLEGDDIRSMSPITFEYF